MSIFYISLALLAQESMSGTPEFPVFSYSQTRTKLGQLVEFIGRPEDLEAIGKTLGIARSVTLPETHRVGVSHGGYGSYSRYDIEQLDLSDEQKAYAGGEGGYIEALQIKDAPDGRANFVLHDYDSYTGRHFVEFTTAAQTVSAFESTWSSEPSFHSYLDLQNYPPPTIQERYAKFTGFKRYVHCGELTPWFYAIGDQELVGDYVIPENMQDDPVFKLGERFIVEKDGAMAIKTCLGTRFREISNNSSWSSERKTYPQRVVYWQDGTTWKDNLDGRNLPRLLRDDEVWVMEAMDQFKKMLSGDQTQFEISFAQGGKFVGQFKPANPSASTKEGTYNCSVTLTDGKVAKGSVNFTPTPELPTVQQFITEKFKRRAQIEIIEATLLKTKPDGKKWSGVFYGRPKLK